jgi:hypothetical protein
MGEDDSPGPSYDDPAAFRKQRFSFPVAMLADDSRRRGGRREPAAREVGHQHYSIQ